MRVENDTDDNGGFVMDKQCEYICRSILGFDWQPKISPEAQAVLDGCATCLERMYILGACHSIDKIGLEESDYTDLVLESSTVVVGDQTYNGIWVVEPWSGWFLPDSVEPLVKGPEALLFVPRYKSPEQDITHAMALFYGEDKKNPRWSLRHIVDIDGREVDGDTRAKEILRDNGLPYKVERFYEEIDGPKIWFQRIILTDIMANNKESIEKNVNGVL
ncbi:unknown protein [Desulfotalea psychrophila LSv54]|uniref:Uncharacterized protein n=2 Tax=Desulfotalea psychrophila TaxID=84980 RepID=Q6AQB1_DESPS|nr:unknown protein [Desulfotalea psychrophila LSv54]